MIRVERDPAFWIGIASHPALTGALLGLAPAALGDLAGNAAVLPLAAQHGGFLFSQLDAFGFVRELHAIFTPEGWGSEVSSAGKEALEYLFGGPCKMLVAMEVRDNPASRVPKSFGFTPVSDWSATIVGDGRLWFLTRDAWRASPAYRRMVN